MRIPLVSIFFLAGLLTACSSDQSLGDAARDGRGRADGSSTDDGTPDPQDIVIRTPGVPTDVETRFMRPGVSDPARSAAIQYPLDRVLFPRNVYAPDVQWTGPGVAGDLYRVRFLGAPVTVTAYLIHTGSAFNDDYLVGIDAWRLLSASGAGREVTLTVDRWDSTRDEVISGAPVRVRFARGSIAGAVYYWTLGEFGDTQGRIVRVMQGTDVAPRVENFMPSPPPRPDGNRCAACHSLSRDGNHLAVSLGDGEFGAVYDVTTDLTGANPPALFILRQPWFYAAFSPDASRVFMTDSQRHSFLLNGADGTTITPATGPLPDATHPNWSADGALLAYITSANDAWNLNSGDLSVTAAMGGDRFGATRVLHRGADLSSAPEGGGMDAYPTFSPDSRFLVFQHGTRVLASAAGATGALYAVPAGGGAPLRLSNASAGATVGNAWYPNFTPFVTPAMDSSTVYWVLLYSRRDYGNARAGTQGTNRRQIWVSAIDTSMAAGSDPSNVPYWLPGQEVGQENASAYWAPRPCRSNNASCSSDGQCCSNSCVSLTAARMACAPPPMNMCRRSGESCSQSTDCCDASLACSGNVCIPTPG